MPDMVPRASAVKSTQPDNGLALGHADDKPKRKTAHAPSVADAANRGRNGGVRRRVRTEQRAPSKTASKLPLISAAVTPAAPVRVSAVVATPRECGPYPNLCS